MPTEPLVLEEVVRKVQMSVGIVFSPHLARSWKREKLSRDSSLQAEMKISRALFMEILPLWGQYRKLTKNNLVFGVSTHGESQLLVYPKLRKGCEGALKRRRSQDCGPSHSQPVPIKISLPDSGSQLKAQSRLRVSPFHPGLLG